MASETLRPSISITVWRLEPATPLLRMASYRENPGSKPLILSRRCSTGTRWRVGLQYRATSLVYSHQRAQRVPIWTAEESPKTAILRPNVGVRCCACAARARSASRPRAARLMVTPRGPISDLSALILLKESSPQVLLPMDKRRAFSSSPFWCRCITVHQ